MLRVPLDGLILQIKLLGLGEPSDFLGMVSCFCVAGLINPEIGLFRRQACRFLLTSDFLRKASSGGSGSCA